MLRAYHHPEVAEWLASHSASPDAALVEAATIAAALENMRRGRRFVGSGRASGRGTALIGAADLDSEVQWLSQVARVFRRSPAIPALLRRLREEEG